MKKKFICGNWKLNHNLAETKEVLLALMGATLSEEIEVAVAPVATTLMLAGELLRDSKIALAGQNVFYEPAGAFTGEWSVAHLKELGCSHCIVGHSERRQYFNETDDSVQKKVNACFAEDIVPIACVGETLAERDSGQVASILKRQVGAIIAKLSKLQIQDLVIAYEPIWAIGTGRTASPELANEAHEVIRGIVEQKFDANSAESVRILYGGSVKPQNTALLMTQQHIDGALVGGASLKPVDFLGICSAL